MCAQLKKQGETEAKANGEAKPQRPQRFSTTSGVGEAPRQKQTWSVGNVVNEGKSRSRRRPVKDQATGVNAIPVG
jgi:nucleolar protein 6